MPIPDLKSVKAIIYKTGEKSWQESMQQIQNVIGYCMGIGTGLVQVETHFMCICLNINNNTPHYLTHMSVYRLIYLCIIHQIISIQIDFFFHSYFIVKIVIHPDSPKT